MGRRGQFIFVRNVVQYFRMPCLCASVWYLTWTEGIIRQDKPPSEHIKIVATRTMRLTCTLGICLAVKVIYVHVYNLNPARLVKVVEHIHAI